MPCSPSELVLGYYYSILKQQAKWGVRKRLFKAFDASLLFMSSPASTIGEFSRETILRRLKGPRSLEVKLFNDKDLGVLQTWFTLSLYHSVSFSQFVDRCGHKKNAVPYESFQEAMVTLDIVQEFRVVQDDDVDFDVVREEAKTSTVNYALPTLDNYIIDDYLSLNKDVVHATNVPKCVEQPPDENGKLAWNTAWMLHQTRSIVKRADDEGKAMRWFLNDYAIHPNTTQGVLV